MMLFSLRALLAVVVSSSLAGAHTIITYPGWRGDNLYTNGTRPEENPGTIGIDYDTNNGTWAFPYGMQWMYPCGGMPLTTNRTKWPVGGGALSIQPGWFPGHSQAFFYVNIGISASESQNPPNMSHPVVPPFQITGPTNLEYPGQFCILQVGMPANLTFNIGDNITIQVIETAQHGASLYSCVDVTLADPADVEPVTPANCYNSSDIGFNLVFTTTSLTSAASSLASSPSSAVVLIAMVLAVVTLSWA